MFKKEVVNLKNAMVLACLFFVMALGTWGCEQEMVGDAPFDEDEKELETQTALSSLTGKVRYPSYANCEENLRVIISKAMNELKQFKEGGVYFSAFENCLKSAPLFANKGNNAEHIARALGDNYETDIRCRELGGNTNASAFVGYRHGESIRLDRDFLRASDTPRVASVIAHEIMHNRNYSHVNEADYGKQYYDNTVLEQVEKCVDSTLRGNPQPHSSRGERSQIYTELTPEKSNTVPWEKIEYNKGEIKLVSRKTPWGGGEIDCPVGMIALGGGGYCTDGELHATYPKYEDYNSAPVGWRGWARGRSHSDCKMYAICAPQNWFGADDVVVRSASTGYGKGSVDCPSGRKAISGGSYCSNGDFDVAYPKTDLNGWNEWHRGASSEDCRAYAVCLDEDHWLAKDVYLKSSSTRESDSRLAVARCNGNDTVIGGGSYCQNGESDWDYPVSNLSGWKQWNRGDKSNCRVYGVCVRDSAFRSPKSTNLTSQQVTIRNNWFNSFFAGTASAENSAIALAGASGAKREREYRIFPNSDGTFSIQHAATFKKWQVQDDNLIHLTGWTYRPIGASKDDFKFILKPIGNGEYYIQSKESGKYVAMFWGTGVLVDSVIPSMEKYFRFSIKRDIKVCEPDEAENCGPAFVV